jgi:putative aldouronate transport system permease protein
MTKEERKFRNRTIWAGVKRDKHLYLMLVLPVLFFLIFWMYPLYFLQIAFKDYKPFLGVAKSEWVGFEHFVTFFSSPYFVRTLKNTLMINVYGIIFKFPAAIILALLFNEVKSKMFTKVTQTLVYMPHFISAVVVAGMVITFLSPSSGFINQLIVKLGGNPIYFLAEAKYFRGIYTTMGIWHEVGFSSIVFIAALHAVDQDLYEAARIDGAGKLAQVRYVTIPGILPTIVIQLIIAVGGIINVGYETIILLYQPSTYETADVISTYVYRSGLQEGNYSFATAVSIFNSVVAVLLVSVVNKISRKVNETSLW